MKSDAAPREASTFLLVLAAAGGIFALTMGTRQTMGLFVSPLNTATGLGLGSIGLAFAFGQLWWGLTQPFAGAMADRVGAGRVLFAGTLLVALGTVITPFMTSTAGLIFAVGVLAAGGAGMAGPAVLMAAATRLVPPHRRGVGPRGGNPRGGGGGGGGGAPAGRGGGGGGGGGGGPPPGGGGGPPPRRR